LTSDQLTIALAAVAGVTLVTLLVAFVLALRLKKLRRDYAILRGDGEERDVLAAVGRALKKVDAVDKRIDGLFERQTHQAEISAYALQKFALVRYDAFEEMGGRLSFSAAILDDHGDGVVFTSINGRTETRTYAKPIKSLSSQHNLSGEEKEAIAAAAAGYERSESIATVPR
jgi:hypothetical protein